MAALKRSLGETTEAKPAVAPKPVKESKGKPDGQTAAKAPRKRAQVFVAGESRLQDPSSKSREHRMRVLEYQARIAAESGAPEEKLSDPQAKMPLIMEVKGSGSSKQPARRSRRKSGTTQPNLGDL